MEAEEPPPLPLVENPADASRKYRTLSCAATATVASSGLKATSLIQCLEGLTRATSARSGTLNAITVPSSRPWRPVVVRPTRPPQPTTSVAPSWEKAAARAIIPISTDAVCLRSDTDHSRTVWSSPAVATVWPSGEMARPQSSSLWWEVVSVACSPATPPSSATVRTEPPRVPYDTRERSGATAAPRVHCSLPLSSELVMVATAVPRPRAPGRQEKTRTVPSLDVVVNTFPPSAPGPAEMEAMGPPWILKAATTQRPPGAISYTRPECVAMNARPSTPKAADQKVWDWPFPAMRTLVAAIRGGPLDLPRPRDAAAALDDEPTACITATRFPTVRSRPPVASSAMPFTGSRPACAVAMALADSRQR
mmetsp:Transcript_15487/g.58686  ORF Transcript_15487/g.58686 Transcript_15487/m.58686 type:complete len:365 (+) Transcript_15487:727-1821(+)